jgi:uncharacterized membrane protein YeaQ/YmgE (transglycosylase-associated protein family)
MWTLIIIIIVGGLIGWVASKIMGTDAQQGILLNIVVGIVGALLAGFLLSPLLGVDSILDDPLSIPAILLSLVGAIALIWIVKLVRR